MIGSVLRVLNGFSFKEKSTITSLVAVAGIYGTYFYDVLMAHQAQSLGSMLGTMIGLVVALVVVHIVFHIVIALDDHAHDDDERDRAISRRASVFGYNVLVVGVLLVIGHILILGSVAQEAAGVAVPGPVTIINLLLACLVASEVVYYASQLFLYRRGLIG